MLLIEDKSFSLCPVCDRLVQPNCHYLTCPKKENRAVNEKVSRTLWVVTESNSLAGHEAYRKLFDKVEVLGPGSKVTKNGVLFFDGGTDINPFLYGEEPHAATGKSDHVRDAREVAAFKLAKEIGAKCLGTCRGAQLLCALSGGKLVQHVTGHYTGGHMLITRDGDSVYTESSHHQVMWPGKMPHVLIAWADTKAQQPFQVSDEYGKTFPDGQFPEIIYCKDTGCLCIQGHSEWVSEQSAFHKLTHDLVRKFLFDEQGR